MSTNAHRLCRVLLAFLFELPGCLGPLSIVSPRCGTTNNAQAQPLGVASRAAELRGGLWRAAGGKTGRLSVEWGTTVEHTVWGACAEHARLQQNDNDD